jgi:ribose transport system ATP-binding protein
MSSPDPRPDALSVASLSKTFSGVTVLKDVSLTIAPGEVHALLGQNGSGKSTLIKCLAGVHRPDAGASMRVAGRALPNAYTPSDSRTYGLAFVHQDLGLIDDMTVAETLAIGTGFETTGFLINPRAQRARAQAILDEFGLAISPNTTIRELPVTARTLLAIARAFQPVRGDDADPLSCLILDEPTAALPDNDAELLFAAIARVTARGVGVGYVTHRLDEVFRIADRATILRDGSEVGTHDVAALTPSGLFTAIVGQRSGDADGAGAERRSPQRVSSRPVLEVSELSGRRIRGATMTVEAGEIVGVAGLAGSGRSELARLIFGSQASTGGERRMSGRAVATTSPRSAMDSGIAMVPEDRRRDGCVLTMSVAENLTLAKLTTNALGFLDVRAERARVDAAISSFDIRPADPRRAVGTLSGGNQQKIVLAKWLARSPELMILDEPVQGVDVGAKSDIFRLLRDAAAGGTAVLVIDSDFDNLAVLCDRVVILRDGRIVDELTGDGLTTENMSRATFGVDDDSDLITESVQPYSKDES